jgi:hypothetical protein
VFKIPLSFHYTGWLIGISLLDYSDPQYIAGWWVSHPSEKYDFVSWDDEIPN